MIVFSGKATIMPHLRRFAMYASHGTHGQRYSLTIGYGSVAPMVLHGALNIQVKLWPY